MALLQMLGHGKAATFGELASKIFDVVRRLFNTSSVLRVDIVFDRYDTALNQGNGKTATTKCVKL